MKISISSFIIRKLKNLPLLGLLIAIFFWILGLIFFNQYVDQYQNPDISDLKAEAIIVLTGGQNRVKTGFDLYRQGVAPQLYVSGVNNSRGFNQKFIQDQVAAQAIAFDDRAFNTEENALETKKWVESEQISQAILVTSNYHMPRAQMEFRRHIPNLTIIPYAVTNTTVETKNWIQFKSSRQLLIMEYNKYLFSTLKYIKARTLHAFS